MSIYKYVTAERIDVLKEVYICFTQPSVFNDPFEVYPYFKAMTNDEYAKKLINDCWNEKNLEKTVEEIYLEQSKKNPFIKHIPDLKEKLKRLMALSKPVGQDMFKSILTLNSPNSRQLVISSMRKSLDQVVGILCLTEIPDNPIMWAHYSDSHQGFVIEFDEKHNYFDRRTKPEEIRRHLKKVTYSKKRPEILFYDSRLSDSENLDIWINKFFWNKSDFWEYEQEWRMFDTLSDCKRKIKKNNQDIYLFPLPLDCIKGIILGCRMSEENKSNFINLLQSDKKYSHIKIYHAVIDEKEFQLNII